MKYFTKELYRASQDLGRQAETTAEWQRRFSTYRQELDDLSSLLTKRGLYFFSKTSLHDGQLMSVLIGDGLTRSIQALVSDRSSLDTSVKMAVLTYQRDRIYKLEYRDVASVAFQYPSEDPLILGYSHPIGDWLYDELSKAGTGLRHEVLFASGATFSVEFKRFSFTRQKVGRQKIKK